jgi:hypothetical protein
MKKAFLANLHGVLVCIVRSSPNKRQKETNCSTQYPAGYYKVFCAQIQCTKTPHQTHNGIISREHHDGMLTEICHFRKAHLWWLLVSGNENLADFLFSMCSHQVSFVCSAFPKFSIALSLIHMLCPKFYSCNLQN